MIKSASTPTNAVTPDDSTNPYEGLQSLGSIELRQYTIRIFATELGPRYSIFDNVSGTELGTLLSVEQANRAFPDLQLPALEFGADSQIHTPGPLESEWL